MSRLVPASATALGMIRAGVCGVFLLTVLATSFQNLGRLPVTILRPTGIMQLFSWGFYDRLVTPGGMSVLKYALAASLALSTVGYLTRLSTITSALLLIFYQGLLRSFGHFTHDEMAGVYFLIVLAATPCGDGFSVDSLARTRRRHAEGFVYGYPILLMQSLLAWGYFSSAVIKLRVMGAGYFNPDTLPTLAIIHSLDNLHDTHFRLAFLLPEASAYLPVAVGLIVVWEFAFPLAVVWRRARVWILSVGVLFHFSTLFLMNIFFPYTLAMYLVFIDWESVSNRLARVRPWRGLREWWRDFRGVPEEFDGVKIADTSLRESLLWDGDCGFCGAMVGRLQRLARRPFQERPSRTVEEKLPDEVRRAAREQMHWIDADGAVTGGSRALVELLDASGRKSVAALLDSPPCRPFAWLGYRLVARHRDKAARLAGQPRSNS